MSADLGLDAIDVTLPNKKDKPVKAKKPKKKVSVVEGAKEDSNITAVSELKKTKPNPSRKPNQKKKVETNVTSEIVDSIPETNMEQGQEVSSSRRRRVSDNSTGRKPSSRLTTNINTNTNVKDM